MNLSVARFILNCLVPITVPLCNCSSINRCVKRQTHKYPQYDISIFKLYYACDVHEHTITTSRLCGLRHHFFVINKISFYIWIDMGHWIAGKQDGFTNSQEFALFHMKTMSPFMKNRWLIVCDCATYLCTVALCDEKFLH